MGSNEVSILAPSQRKAQKLKISNRRYTDHLALFHVHSAFQFSLKNSSAGFEQSLSGSFALAQQYNIVRISNNRYASAAHLPVKFVQVDVGKQRTERPCL